MYHAEIVRDETVTKMHVKENDNYVDISAAGQSPTRP